jgi:hypothetical protein
LLTPQIGDVVAHQTVSANMVDSPEREKLYIPSDFNMFNRLKYDLVELGELERRLHEGAAYDAIQKSRTISRTISALEADKKANAYGQALHTRAASQILDVEARLSVTIDDYMSTRASMISLGLAPNDPSFLPLQVSDTFRKRTNAKRALGDSRRTEGLIWIQSGVTGNSCPSASHVIVPSETIGTQSIKAKREVNLFVPYFVNFVS